MKKILLSIVLLVAGIVTASAQVQPNVASLKANEKATKGDVLALQGTPEAVQEAQALFDEAEAILKEDIEKAKLKDDNSKLARLYLQYAELQGKKLNPIMREVQQGLPFDTVRFCQLIDYSIQYYNEAATYNVKPNAKGKVKTDKMVTMMTNLGVTGYLKHYYYCGAFMDGMGNKQASLDYFKKYVDLPTVSPVFSAAERDSIYRADAKDYSVARFNLALQNFLLKNWDETLTCCDVALKDTLGINDLYIMKANAYGEKKDSANWARTLVEATQRTGDNSFYQTLMYNYMTNNRVAEGKALADKLVADAPNDKVAWFMKGNMEINVLKDYDAARASLEKALAIDANYEDALYSIGSAYINDVYEQAQAGKFKTKAAESAAVKEYYTKALPYLEHLRELTPDNARRWASPLQMVYSGLGMTDKAKEMDSLLEAANTAQ